MSQYRFVVGQKQNNFKTLEKFRKGIIELSKNYDTFICKKETVYTDPFNADMIVVAINQKEKEPVRGFARLSILTDGHGELDSSLVRPEDTRQGLWHSMVKILIKKSDEMGVKELMAIPASGDEFLEEPLRRKGFVRESVGSEMWRRNLLG